MPQSQLQFEHQSEGFYRRYKISSNNRTLFCFNPGEPNANWADFDMRRPSIHPLYTPAGFPVTEQGAHNFPHHKGCWIAHALVNQVNLYHDLPTAGRIITRKANWNELNGVGIFDAEIEWVDAALNVLLHEKRRHWVRPSVQANRIDIRIELTTPLEKAELGVEKHAFFHIRIIEALSESAGSIVRASNGITGAMKIFKSQGLWIDCRGAISGLPVGACIMGHPDEGPQPLFARPYGTLALNPFFEKPTTLLRGQTWKRTYSVIAYDDAQNFDVESAYKEFGSTKFE